MSGFFSYQEGSILVRLLLAHCLADFFLQSNKGVQQKKERLIRSPYLWWHTTLVTLLTALFLWDGRYWKQILLIAVTHALFDIAKLYASWKNKNDGSKRELWLFLTDQALHVAVIVAAWLWIISGWQRLGQLLAATLPDYRILIRILAYVVAAGPVSYLIRFLTDKWATELEENEVGLKNAGMWIGFLERTLIITFVFINQFSAIGFLVAAKSILRLIDKPPSTILENKSAFNARKHTEYVVIGTFLSFTSALLIALATTWLLHLQQPSSFSH